MQCKQAREQIDRLRQPVQASAELTQHTAECPTCAKFIDERTALHHALANLRAETAALGPTIHVEQNVLAALDATAFKPRHSQYTLRWITGGALSFAALLIASVLFPLSLTHTVKPIAEMQQEKPFTAMPYVVPPTQYERITTIRTQVSLQIMQYAGFEVHDDIGSTTLADVVYGEDGRILALRLVTQPNSATEKRID